MVVDEYLAIRSLLGSVPDSVPDDVLAITSSVNRGSCSGSTCRETDS